MRTFMKEIPIPSTAGYDAYRGQIIGTLETGRNHTRPTLGRISSMKSYRTFIVARASTPKAPEANFDGHGGAVERTRTSTGCSASTSS